jgi:hypothetical protein
MLTVPFDTLSQLTFPLDIVFQIPGCFVGVSGSIPTLPVGWRLASFGSLESGLQLPKGKNRLALQDSSGASFFGILQ